MCSGNEEDAVKISDEDLQRVRELRETAREALIEANRILAEYMNIDAESIDSVTIGLGRDNSPLFDDGGVPPVQICTQYYSGGACAYEECDPPGVTRPCIPITLAPE
jgi:hypothetical protein